MMNSTLPIKSKQQHSIDYINLSNRQFAEYKIVFRVNELHKLNNIGDFRFKEQLSFERYENNNLQSNLMLLDSNLQIIIADIALLVSLRKINNLNDYIYSNERISFPAIKNDKSYFERKIMDFLNGLLYGEVAANDIWNGDTDGKRIYCYKNRNNELKCYSIYESMALYDLLKNSMKITLILSEIDSCKRVSACLKYSF